MIWMLFLLFSEPSGSTDLLAKYRAHVRFLASDALEGREATYSGQRVAAQYIATQLEMMGMEPGMGSSYFQNFELEVTGIDPSSIKYQIRGRGKALNEGANLLALQVFDFGVYSKSGPIAFAGYGISNDDYDDYAGQDVRGHWVVIHHGKPKGDGPLFSKDEVSGTRFYHKYMTAVAKGALGLIRIRDGEHSGHRTGVSINLPGESEEDEERHFPVFSLNESDAEAFFGKHFKRYKKSLETIRLTEKPAPFVLKGRTFQSAYRTETESKPTENVVAVLPGQDPELKDEHIVISAHYDHIGVSNAGVNNGADDNASGVATLLNLAERLKEQDRRRSLTFLFLTGEEHGLLGSKYYVTDEAVSLDKIVANLNFDMVGRNAFGGLAIIPGQNDDVSSLNEWLKQANTENGHDMMLKEDQDRFHRRSDHYTFVKEGIPAVFFFGGIHDDYHQPGDDWELLDFDFMLKAHYLYEDFLLKTLNHDEKPKFLKDRDQSASSSGSTN